MKHLERWVSPTRIRTYTETAATIPSTARRGQGGGVGRVRRRHRHLRTGSASPSPPNKVPASGASAAMLQRRMTRRHNEQTSWHGRRVLGPGLA
jgi:hypothetical protein